MGDQLDLEWRERGAEVPVLAMARADELKEVLLNVLENARLAQARTVTADVAIDDGRVNIAVQDDGQGIAPDVLPRIFEPHFSTRTSGSGLGLAISRRLVEVWGGEITVESTLGRGTTVTVALLRAGQG
jgi:signal transduction histidine kinase